MLLLPLQAASLVEEALTFRVPCAGFEDDIPVVKWLAHKHGVVVIPGSACGVPGHIRVSFGRPEPSLFSQAADRLNAGLKDLIAKGQAALTS